MSIIELNKGNCQNCYKCIRHCPIKAIEFKHSRAKVIKDECILCGTCVETCPQNAKSVKNDTDDVKALIREGKKVYVSVAPSFGAYFNASFPQISAALKKLGFAGVEETAIGAYETSREYTNLVQAGQMSNIIVTACSSVVMLIERHYKDLIKMLAPVASPMMAHAKLMRESYGDIKVVFVGPCIAKKDEAADLLAGGFVNWALTFSDIEEWLLEKGIRFGEDDPNVTGVIHPVSRLYPKPLGIIDTIDKELFGEKYRTLSVDGFDKCVELFDELKNNNNLKGLFIEANICSGGCLGGPIMQMNHKNSLLGQFTLSNNPLNFDASPSQSAKTSFPHPRVFSNRSPHIAQPTQDDIVKILAKIGKLSKEDELNCGSCGYPSCREKAKAVFQGKADIHMCLPFFRQQAENMSATVMEHSPNAILIFDSEQRLLDLNPAAQSMLNINKPNDLGEYPPQFYGETDFDDAKAEECVKNKKISINGGFAEQSILYVKEHAMYLAFIKDINEDEKRKKEMDHIREHTVMTAQKVIDKQMRVAQEIASLLGETTAETKVALTKLKKSMQEQQEK